MVSVSPAPHDLYSGLFSVPPASDGRPRRETVKAPGLGRWLQEGGDHRETQAHRHQSTDQAHEPWRGFFDVPYQAIKEVRDMVTAFFAFFGVGERVHERDVPSSESGTNTYFSTRQVVSLKTRGCDGDSKLHRSTPLCHATK